MEPKSVDDLKVRWRSRLRPALLGLIVVAAACADSTDSSGTTTITRPISSDPVATTTIPAASATTEFATTNEATAPTSTSTSPTTVDALTPGSPQEVPIQFESEIDDVSAADLATTALEILNDPRGWSQAGFTFVNGAAAAPYRVVLAEGPRVDELCLPLRTGSFASCQNGPVVALNADRWRSAVAHWDNDLALYRGYLVNHEVGHLIGMRHPTPRCPVPGAPAAVMEQQTGGLAGCTGNAWPRDWELDYAKVRPVVYAPLPSWGPDPIPANLEAG